MDVTVREFELMREQASLIETCNDIKSRIQIREQVIDQYTKDLKVYNLFRCFYEVVRYIVAGILFTTVVCWYRGESFTDHVGSVLGFMQHNVKPNAYKDSNELELVVAFEVLKGAVRHPQIHAVTSPPDLILISDLSRKYGTFYSYQGRFQHKTSALPDNSKEDILTATYVPFLEKIVLFTRKGTNAFQLKIDGTFEKRIDAQMKPWAMSYSNHLSQIVMLGLTENGAIIYRYDRNFKILNRFQIQAKPSISHVVALDDGGVVVMNKKSLTKYDSYGSQLWSRGGTLYQAACGSPDGEHVIYSHNNRVTAISSSASYTRRLTEGLGVQALTVDETGRLVIVEEDGSVVVNQLPEGLVKKYKT